jgi:hypothetical protein
MPISAGGILNHKLTDKMTVSAGGSKRWWWCSHGGIVKAKLSATEEAANVETHDDAPTENAKAIVEIDKTEVWGSDTQFF